MGRIAVGYHLEPPAAPGGVWYVRFTVKSERYHLSTGSRSKGQADARAKGLYQDALQGRLRRRKAPAAGPSPLLLDLLDAWLESLAAGYSANTIKTWEGYARAHWLTRWARLEELTEAAFGEYQRARLGVVVRATVRKEIVALRRFGEWCKEQGHLAALFTFPRMPPKATGVRNAHRKETATELSAADVRAILGTLPERSVKVSRRDGRVFWVRPFFEFLWETGLRPATVEALRAGEHWSRGQDALEVSATIDKVRFARRVPLTARAVAILEACAGASGEPIFGDYDRRSYVEPKKIHGSGLPAAKLQTFSPYDFRHARLTHWAEEGGPLPAVAHLAGHRQITTTAIYAKATERAARRLVGSRMTARRIVPARPVVLARAWDDGGQEHEQGAPRKGPVGVRPADLLARLLDAASKGNGRDALVGVKLGTCPPSSSVA